MYREKIFNCPNIKDRKSSINNIEENTWRVGNSIFVNSEEKCIYIQNQYPSNFRSLSSCKNQFSCGICKQEIQSKKWFGLNQQDYELGCIHIKHLISAIYWGRENINISYITTGRLPYLAYAVPSTCLEVERAKIILSNLSLPIIKQVLFMRNIECLGETESLSASYNIICYPELKWSENIVKYSKRNYKCTCSNNIYNNGKYVCDHILKVVGDEEIKTRKLGLVLFLINKYFEN